MSDINGVIDTTALAPPPAASPFARNSQDNCNQGQGAVQRHVGLPQAFISLRDMNIKDVIRPNQLTIMKLLGQGAFATVEKAMYTPAGGGKPFIVAVKKLRMELFRNQEDLDLFVQEISLMRKLRHRNIVEFVGAGEVKAGELPGQFACEFVVQEYMAGGNLKQFVTHDMLRNGRSTYTDVDALDICLQMARGLRYLHKSRPMVIHRDLKLENVLLGESPGKGKYIVKLADFGLSRRVQMKQQALSCRRPVSGLLGQASLPVLARLPSALPSLLDRNASCAVDNLEEEWNARAQSNYVAWKPPPAISDSDSKFRRLSYVAEENAAYHLTGRTGSLMYMAPEVYLEQPYNEKADVFSFAVMVYEVLQRYIMLSAVSVNGTYEELEAYCCRVALGYRPPLHAKWPASVVKLVQDCWAQDPAARPNMDEVVTRLEAIQQSGEMASLDKAHQGCSCTIS